MKPILLIDRLGEWYRAQLAPKFPDLEIRIATDGHDADAAAAARDAQVILGMGHHFNEHLIGGAFGAMNTCYATKL